MHLVIVSDLEMRGGAAIAASRLADRMLQRSVRVTRIVGEAENQTFRWSTHRMIPTGRPYQAVRRYSPPAVWRNVSRGITAARFRRLLGKLEPSVINIHNLHMGARDGWSPLLASLASEIAPTVWTLHDMWSFTGGCNYAFGSDRYTETCDRNCLSFPGHERLTHESIAAAWDLRASTLQERGELVAVTPSRWLRGEAQKGLWRGHRIEVIGNPLPMDTFRPLERTEARARLGLPRDGKIVLAAGHNLTAPRKGIGILGHALADHGKDITVALMGKIDSALDWPGLDIKHLGILSDDHAKALAYSAADILVHASAADNLSNVIAESLSCGTPAVAFDVGGNPELIRPGFSGWLARPPSAESLSSTLGEALGQIASGADLRDSCRAVVRELCDPEVMTDRYLALFQSLVKDRPR